MKKLVAILLVACMMLAMTACGSSDSGKYVIGICQLAPHDALDAASQGFIDRLTELLGEENVEFNYQKAAGDSATCAPIINAFIAEDVDLILANATSALQTAKGATKTIPILGTSVTEYGVAMDIENFSGTVGGNVSGTSDLAPLDQQAAMILEWVPNAKNVGLLYCSAEPNSKYQVDKVQEYLEAKGLTVKQYPFADSNDMAAVTEDAASNSDVIYIPTDNAVASATGIVDSICRPKKIPVIAGEAGICSGCGIATLSISYYDLGVKTAEMAYEILTGKADIATMPIGYVDKITPKYNAQICEDLGITPLAGYEPLS